MEGLRPPMLRLRLRLMLRLRLRLMLRLRRYTNLLSTYPLSLIHWVSRLRELATSVERVTGKPHVAADVQRRKRVLIKRYQIASVSVVLQSTDWLENGGTFWNLAHQRNVS